MISDFCEVVQHIVVIFSADLRCLSWFNWCSGTPGQELGTKHWNAVAAWANEAVHNLEARLV